MMPFFAGKKGGKALWKKRKKEFLMLKQFLSSNSRGIVKY